MRLYLLKCFVVGALVISPLGCEPRPVVQPADDDTTIIQEGDVDRDVAEPGTGVDVNVGRDQGVDVDVQRDPAGQPDRNP